MLYEYPSEDCLPIFWVWFTTPCSWLSGETTSFAKKKEKRRAKDHCSGSFLIHNCIHLSPVPGHLISWPHFSQRCLSPWPLTCLSLPLITQPYPPNLFPGPYHPAPSALPSFRLPQKRAVALAEAKRRHAEPEVLVQGWLLFPSELPRLIISFAERWYYKKLRRLICFICTCKVSPGRLEK